MIDASTVPLDPTSAQALAGRGLQYRIPDDEEQSAFALAIGRGFLGERATEEQLAAWRDSRDLKVRSVGVYDPTGADPTTPVATTASWVMDVAVDDGSTLPMWSISAVTVAATHRRRGIARALLEGELRAAAAAGVPIAGLTVSEATIYARYGFGVAAHTGTWSIDARRAGWAGPRPTEGDRPGRLDHIERETLAADLAALNAATFARRPGDIAGWPNLWPELAGLRPGKPDPKVRGVRYTDADGATQGVIAYTITGNDADFTRATLDIHALVAATPDAYAALWRYALQHDLVGTVTTSLRSLHEPLRWLIADQRALAVTERDHHWLRILDVPRALQARRLRVPGTVVLTVTDDLGIAEGAWRVDVNDAGAVSVTSVEGDDDHGRHVALGVSELSSLLLGGVTATTLRAAGRIDTDAETAAWLDLAFTPVTAPQLSYWY